MHLIKKNILTIECTSEPVGKEVHSSVSDFLKKEFYPKLELLLDNYCKDDKVVTLEKIIITLPTLKKVNWKRDFLCHSLSEIEEQLKNAINYKNTENSNIYLNKTVSNTVYAFNLFIQFLDSGYIFNNPVYSNISQLETELHKYASEKLTDIQHALLALFEKNHEALIRFLINTSQALRLVLTPQIVENIRITVVTEIENSKWIKINPGKKAMVAAYIAWNEYLLTVNGIHFSTENIENFLKNEIGNKTLHQKLHELDLASAPNFKLGLEKINGTKKTAHNSPDEKYKTEIGLAADKKPEIDVNSTETITAPDKQRKITTQPENDAIAEKEKISRNAPDSIQEINDTVKNNNEDKKETQKIKQNRTTKGKTSEDKTTEDEASKGILSNNVKNDKEYNVASEENRDKLNKTEKSIEETFLVQQNNQALYIENVGLVILYPFLSTLFDQLNLFRDKKWTSFKAHQKAVLITQHLVTSGSIFYENELILNRILCGFPRDKVINTSIRITKKDKSLCKDLLEAVIKHWSLLKDTSTVALQETFLMRNGKLETNSSGATLWVEQKGVDILLAQLPWGINMVKTPWMQDFLECNWYS